MAFLDTCSLYVTLDNNSDCTRFHRTLHREEAMIKCDVCKLKETCDIREWLLNKDIAPTQCALFVRKHKGGENE